MILFVDCCISQRGNKSRTMRLCDAFLKTLQAENNVQIERLDLKNMHLEPFTVQMLDARDELFRAGKFDADTYALARQFASADGIVIGAPFWDLSFPAQLRIYLEHVSANGVTYYYDEQGPHGKCKADCLVYLTAGGDFERDGSIGSKYWEQLCQMYGIREFQSIFAGGLDADPVRTDALLAEACQKAEDLAKRLRPSAARTLNEIIPDSADSPRTARP